MPYKEFVSEKIYFSSGEIAEMFGENISLIRFWSDKFSDFIKPKRNKKGNRQFSKEDVETFKVVYHLVKEKGMTLDGAAQHLKFGRGNLDKNIEIVSSLTSIKEQLSQVYNALGDCLTD